MDPQETRSVLRLEGDCTIATAAEWKGRMLEWLASGGDLQLDLERVEAMDVALLQLLVAAEREAARTGSVITARLSKVAQEAARDAGFDAFPISGGQV